ncbi:hypothetical protein [Caldisalinibacter kiritimatiensis]|uniref:Uncharacterized protein n=1 Tax=Caldisalinibacter kiritimatiensis TaxID=1304284 RepID=R1CQJ9_9FIRM|nr:hypothetical protein [Caldisalinibacter kiritimatiensis]EOD00941.1 hypothetical protein L21TH_1049 [Caldisalinibacter kiritimatiensis]
MQEFDKISISEISKQDMLTILEALDYTGRSTNKQHYIVLKNNIIKELSSLAESSEEEFIKYLKSHI